MLVSGMQQSESVIHIHIHSFFLRFFSHIGGGVFLGEGEGGKQEKAGEVAEQGRVSR